MSARPQFHVNSQDVAVYAPIPQRRRRRSSPPPLVPRRDPLYSMAPRTPDFLIELRVREAQLPPRPPQPASPRMVNASTQTDPVPECLCQAEVTSVWQRAYRLFSL